MPRIRLYEGRDRGAFMALDVETGVLALHGATDAEREAFRARWPALLETRFGFGEAGPTGADHQQPLVLDDDDGSYAGHLWLTEQEELFSGKRRLFVTTIAVTATHRSRGFGRLLMEHAVAEARRRGLPSIALAVDADNEGAIRLYDRLGFQTTRLTMEQPL